MIKKKIVAALLFTLLVLTGCQPSPKQEFAKQAAAFAKGDQLSYHITATITDAKGELTSQEMIGKSLMVDANIDKTAGLIGVTLDVAALVPDTPQLDMIWDDKAGKLYLSAEAMAKTAQIDPQAVKGRYLDMEEVSPQGSNLEPGMFFEKGEDTNSSYLFEHLKDSYFKREGDQVSLTVLLSDWFKMAAETDNSSQTEEVKLYQSLLNSWFKDTSTLTYTFDKTGKADIVLTADLTAGNPLGLTQLTLTMTMEKNAATPPKRPTAKELLTLNDFQQLIGSHQANLTDEQFDELYQGLKAERSKMSVSDYEELITAIRPNLTEQQYQKLQELN